MWRFQVSEWSFVSLNEDWFFSLDLISIAITLNINTNDATIGSVSLPQHKKTKTNEYLFKEPNLSIP